MRLPRWHGSHAFPRGCGFKPKRNESDLSFAFLVRRHPLPRPVSSGQLLGCATENRRENRAGCAYPSENPFYDERSLLPRSVISLFAADTTIVTIGLVEKRFTLLLQPFFYAFILFRFNVFHRAIFRYIHIRIYLFIHIYISVIYRQKIFEFPADAAPCFSTRTFRIFFMFRSCWNIALLFIILLYVYYFYRLALSCNNKYRSIVDEMSNAIRIEES